MLYLQIALCVYVAKEKKKEMRLIFKQLMLKSRAVIAAPYVSLMYSLVYVFIH